MPNFINQNDVGDTDPNYSKAVDVAYLVLDVVNTYKRTVNLPETPETAERLSGIIDGILHYWKNPTISARDNHESWRERMINNGWAYGEQVNEELKTHPALVDFDDVPTLYRPNDILFLAVANHYRPVNL